MSCQKLNGEDYWALKQSCSWDRFLCIMDASTLQFSDIKTLYLRRHVLSWNFVQRHISQLCNLYTKMCSRVFNLSARIISLNRSICLYTAVCFSHKRSAVTKKIIVNSDCPVLIQVADGYVRVGYPNNHHLLTKPWITWDVGKSKHSFLPYHILS